MERYIKREQKPIAGSHESIMQIPRAPMFNPKMKSEFKPQSSMVEIHVPGYNTMLAPNQINAYLRTPDHTNMAAYPRTSDHTNMAAYPNTPDHTNMAAYPRTSELTNMAVYAEHYAMPAPDMGGYGKMAPPRSAYGGGQTPIEYYEKEHGPPPHQKPQIMFLNRPEYSDPQPSYRDHYRPNMPTNFPRYEYESSVCEPPPSPVRNPPLHPSATATNQQGSWIQPISASLVSQPQMLGESKPTLIESQKSFMDIQKETNVSSVADVSMSKSIPSSGAASSKAKDSPVGAIQKPENDKDKVEMNVGLRVFTGNVEKVLKWNKMLQDSGVSCLFEVIGKCVVVNTSKQLQKHFLLRDQTGPVLQVIFHEIDFLMRELANGSMIRVVGKMKGGNIMQSYCVRAARGPEVEALPRLAALAQHHIAKLAAINKI